MVPDKPILLENPGRSTSILLKCQVASKNIQTYNCDRCGNYKIDLMTESYVQDGTWKESNYLISAWIRRENKSGTIPFVGNVINMAEWIEQLRHAGFPEQVNDKLDALLIAYANSVGNEYKRHLDPYSQPKLISEVAAKNQGEILGLTRLLIELGYLNQDKSSAPMTISAKGWLHIEELRKVTATGETAFIAMWFNETTKNYRKAVTTIVQQCGYKPIILDQEEYNGFIMEQVISQIRQARFVVADFTCRPEFVDNGKVKAGVRGGVYWEAGMAYGLNKPVIHTCEENDDSKSRRHFDIDQYNTIFWKPDELSTDIRELSKKVDNPNFAEKLANRILWVVGKGSYKE